MDAARRVADIRSAIRLEWVTVGWMALEFVSAVALGLASGSLLLLAFGLDSFIELASAVLVLQRFRGEYGMRPGSRDPAAMERRAASWTGYLLWALAAYVIGSSAYGLVSGHKADIGVSAWGLVIGAIAVVGMPVLARLKRRLAAADRLNSKSLRADAAEAISCAYLSTVLIAGLLLSRVFGWWWVDSAAALALIPFVVLEGREAIFGEDE
jgi:divalent metal cation (Fe/Co/Zn/Cd) transporter